ncbi:type 1 glutamine amidotransferase domain-containing protein (plasmid) [Ensifer adhaerens]|uniref:type 1 glutamine amidotransferase domain-containing protein n=1 Tax=Ensifer adhaerens TaxID=106592 RepID=UPI0023A9D5A9|nr:type 1 glutamine amidotransferase domain-containing protein [Ensifer adhaerens]WDZ79795.1 type 1 glutamine amidotransferase domain-containing protein [Ensifer adhaerens]
MTETASTTGKPVLFVLTSHGTKGEGGQPTGFYLGEVTHPLAVLDAAGISVEFASIKGGEPPVDGLDLEDKINQRYWNDEAFRTAIRTTAKLDDVEPSRYAAIFFAGGHGAMWDLPQSGAVDRVTRSIFEAGGPVAAVCHGPAALVNVKLSDGSYLVSGRDVSAFTDAEERAVGHDRTVPFLLASTLVERGARHHPGPDWTSKVIVDGRLITGQNPQSATGVGEALRDVLIA